MADSLRASIRQEVLHCHGRMTKLIVVQKVPTAFLSKLWPHCLSPAIALPSRVRKFQFTGFLSVLVIYGSLFVQSSAPHPSDPAHLQAKRFGHHVDFVLSLIL